MQQTILFRGALALAVLSLTLTAHAQQPAHRASAARPRAMSGSVQHEYLNIEEDSSVKPPQTMVTYKSKALYNMVLSDGKIASLYVNGKPVPTDSFYVYDWLVQKLKAQIEQDKAQAVEDWKQAERDKEQAERDAEQAVRDKEQAERDAEQAEKQKHQYEQDAQQAARDKHQAERDAEQAVRDKQQAERDVQQAARDRVQAGKDREQAMRDREQAARDMEQAKRDKIQAEEDKALVKSLKAEVVREGLVPDEKSVRSLQLDESVFYVNGKKQSDELHQKFKAKFIKKEGYSIHFHDGTMRIGQVEQ
ncbi:hypothetical protein Q4E93_30575 [Flavitalea sp. BT771]|uniref:hypothetical protein n=1 Tax=Flavitalea sp. BT771 TaxID=3063329 RepID=UPI0026E390C3|nr:hypothetical protein [Flavitalea sp. BT771]MDO6434999.1 hypothetical protein [Flavitalea sp. BT771]MDV6223899.1 hypothetical protein [Flavitalea sp. BT771]